MVLAADRTAETLDLSCAVLVEDYTRYSASLADNVAAVVVTFVDVVFIVVTSVVVAFVVVSFVVVTLVVVTFVIKATLWLQ